MSTKKKTILRIKRKFSDLPAVDTIVLSQTTQPKKQKTVPWTELCQSFDKNFTINDNDNNKNCNEKKVDTNIDFNFNNCKPKSKKQVFRLISNEKEISRHFQQNTFNEKYSKNRKSKILQQRRSNRQNYFEKIKKEINNNETNNNNNNNNNNDNILQHDDFCDNTNAINTKAKPINKNKNIKMIQNKLLQKQKLNRTTKIVSKKQIKEHQEKLKLKAQNNNNENKSSFSDDWNNNNLITLNYNGERINMKNFLNKYDCFNGYKPKNISQKGINIIDVEFDEYKQKYVTVNGNNKERENEYDYYELDEEADANEVIMAIQMRIKEKEKQKEINEMNKEISGSNGNGSDNKLDLEWKLENIKNKYLTEIEEERNKLMQKYHERVINIDVNEYDNEEENGEEIERDDECHRDNEYPDEHEFSDDEYNLYNIEDDYFPRYNDEYHSIEPEIGDPTNNYSENAFDIEFFKNCDFN